MDVRNSPTSRRLAVLVAFALAGCHLGDASPYDSAIGGGTSGDAGGPLALPGAREELGAFRLGEDAGGTPALPVAAGRRQGRRGFQPRFVDAGGPPRVAAARDPSFRFLALGDCPYSDEQEVQLRRLLRQAERESFDFLMHVGDIKKGEAPCSDEVFINIRDIFRAHPTPVVYTPGDNEWTDCHAVGSDPVERLGRLRELFFRDPNVLRLGELGAKHQSEDSRFAKFIENYRFTRSRVLFIVLHVTGSLNNQRSDDPPSMKEFAERAAANTAFLEESFAEALAKDAPGVALVIHGNPDFERGERAGFKELQDVLRGFLASYRRPVVCIHGDTHYYRIDKPFRDESGKRYLHLTRLEVFGSPTVAGVVVTVDPEDTEVFAYRPYYLEGE